MTGIGSIGENDLRRLLDVVLPGPEGDVEDGPELPARLLSGLADLVPCATITFLVMDSRRRQVVACQELAFADVPEATEDDDAFFFDAYWDCLACSYPERRNDHDSVLSWRDFYSDKEFGALAMSEYFRGAGLWHELLMPLTPQVGLERRLILTRALGDQPFSERDRLLLTLLRPHLVAARERVEARRATVPALTPRQLHLLRRVALGHTNRQIARDLGLSEGTVRKHLENIYARLEVNSRTEALSRVPRAVLDASAP